MAVCFVSSPTVPRICGSGAAADRRGSSRGLIDEVRIYKALPGAEQIAILACPDSLSRIAAIPPQKRTEAQRLKIRNAFLEAGSTGRSAAGMDEVARARTRESRDRNCRDHADGDAGTAGAAAGVSC